MKELLESYKKKLQSVNELIENNTNNGSINDIQRHTRLTTKASEYRAFIVDIERTIKNETISNDISNKSESDIINKFLIKESEYEISEKNMFEHFDEIVNNMLETSKSVDDFIKIKERLKSMPKCASKVLLFRKIILSENEFL